MCAASCETCPQACTPVRGAPVPAMGTIAETPSPNGLAGAAGQRVLAPLGPGRHVDNTPSKGRASKAQKVAAAPPAADGGAQQGAGEQLGGE